MKAIILAAGEGKRLKPFAENMPKCLIELEGKSILDRQIEVIRRCGIDDVIVVKGYMANRINRKDVHYYFNKDYGTTNMVMTLWCAEKELKGEVVVSYGDIVYNEEVLRSLIDSAHDISVVVDVAWEKYWKMRFDDPLKDAEAFKMDRTGRIEIIGQRAERISDIEAGYIGLVKFRGGGMKAFRESFLNARNVSRNGGKAWGAPRPFEKSYMTDMLQGLVNEGHDVYGVKVEGGWVEIDSPSDYDLAKKLFVDGKIKALV